MLCVQTVVQPATGRGASTLTAASPAQAMLAGASEETRHTLIGYSMASQGTVGFGRSINTV